MEEVYKALSLLCRYCRRAAAAATTAAVVCIAAVAVVARLLLTLPLLLLLLPLLQLPCCCRSLTFLGDGLPRENGVTGSRDIAFEERTYRRPMKFH